MHLPGHSFTGPGKKIYRSLNSDGTPKECKPINRVDNAAYHHDLCYSKHDDNKTRNEVCDKTMLDDNELSGTVNPTLRERIDKAIDGKLINTKVDFGLGAPRKTKKILKFTDELAEELYKAVTRQISKKESQHKRYR